MTLHCSIHPFPLDRHIPEIGCSRAGHDGPKGGEPLRNAGHPKLKKKKAKNAKRFSDIAKINRHILQAARKAGKKLKSSSSNPMHIDNLISHEDETDKQPGDVDDNGLTGTFRDALDNNRAEYEPSLLLYRSPSTHPSSRKDSAAISLSEAEFTDQSARFPSPLSEDLRLCALPSIPSPRPRSTRYLDDWVAKPTGG
jgi:hypothetical protein